MEKQSSFTLVGLIVVILVILFVFLLIPLIGGELHRQATRAVCRSNLKHLGQAMILYSNDYDNNYPQLPGRGPWAKDLGFPYDLETPDFSGDQSNTSRSITASWYLLVREADVSPKGFICPERYQKEFDGDNPQNKHIIELWDFGNNPHEHVSYAYHNPYGKFPVSGRCSADFAIAADMSPWFNDGSFVLPGRQGQPPQIITQADESTWKLGVGQYHKGKGQNVLFADGHSSWEKYPNVGVKHDNIYTFWSVQENPSDQDIQGGTAPTGRSAANDAKSEDDSFLAI